MKSPDDIVRALAESVKIVCDCDITEESGRLMLHHTNECPLGMALKWVAAADSISGAARPDTAGAVARPQP